MALAIVVTYDGELVSEPPTAVADHGFVGLGRRQHFGAL